MNFLKLSSNKSIKRVIISEVIRKLMKLLNSDFSRNIFVNNRQKYVVFRLSKAELFYLLCYFREKVSFM